MSDNLRRPPSYQEYPADMAALEGVKLMPLAELGLLTRMRWYCWSNDTIPADPALVARVLGLPEAEVRASWSEAVLSFFTDTTAKGLSGRLECPELVAQMGRLMERREAQSRAADATNAKRIGKRSAKRDAQHHAPEKSRSEKNRTEKSVRQGTDQLQPTHKEFVAAMERAE
jgi:hypothetical protein